MTTSWPSITDFRATVGRLATEADINASQASFMLHSAGERIGKPVKMTLPVFAWHFDKESGERKRCVIQQAERADDITYFGGWMIDEEKQIVGFDSDFELLDSEPET